MRKLSAMVAAGHRAVMVYCQQHGEVKRFALAADIDPAYAAAFALALCSGVEALCYARTATLEGICIQRCVAIHGK